MRAVTEDSSRRARYIQARRIRVRGRESGEKDRGSCQQDQEDGKASKTKGDPRGGRC